MARMMVILKKSKDFMFKMEKKIENPNTNIQGLPVYNSIKDEYCNLQKQLFNETNSFS